MDELLYKVGDIVKIRSDLSCDEKYPMRSGPKEGIDPGVTPEMETYRGEIHTITRCASGYYQIDGDLGNLYWSDEMFESCVENSKWNPPETKLRYKPGDVVIIRHDLRSDDDYPVLTGPARGRTLYCNYEMAEHAGEACVVESYSDEEFYKLKELNWAWTDSMFEDVNECFCSSLL